MRTLTTPAPFDAFLLGDDRAQSAEAQAGLRTFIQVGCPACHSGAGVGGAMYRKFGLVEDYWKATGSAPIDKGRFDVTQDPADLYVFKLASLRNVAMTPPYFHDGSVATLPAAVRVMARVQLGRWGSGRPLQRPANAPPAPSPRLSLNTPGAQTASRGVKAAWRPRRCK